MQRSVFLAAVGALLFGVAALPANAAVEVEALVEIA